MVRKLVAAAAILGLAASIAHAQGNYGGAEAPNAGMGIGTNIRGNGRSPEQLERDREIERKYNEAIKKQPTTAKKSSDPWQNMRATPAPK